MVAIIGICIIIVLLAVIIDVLTDAVSAVRSIIDYLEK